MVRAKTSTSVIRKVCLPNWLIRQVYPHRLSVSRLIDEDQYALLISTAINCAGSAAWSTYLLRPSG